MIYPSQKYSIILINHDMNLRIGCLKHLRFRGRYSARNDRRRGGQNQGRELRPPWRKPILGLLGVTRPQLSADGRGFGYHTYGIRLWLSKRFRFASKVERGDPGASRERTNWTLVHEVVAVRSMPAAKALHVWSWFLRRFKNYEEADFWNFLKILK